MSHSPPVGSSKLSLDAESSSLNGAIWSRGVTKEDDYFLFIMVSADDYG